MLGKYRFHLILLSILVVWLFDVFYVADEPTLVSALSTKTLPLFASVTLPSVPKINPTLAPDMIESGTGSANIDNVSSGVCNKDFTNTGF
jgi:spore maturation protein SpmA